MWEYRARLVRIVDGDTLEVEIDVGFHGKQTEQLRLLGVNTPELKGTSREAGLRAKEFVRIWLVNAVTMAVNKDWPLIIQTQKDDAFGRYLATVFASSNMASLNEGLILSGNAVKDIR